MATIEVGLSGWSYREWRGDFYPADLPGSARLAYVAERFPTLEVNATFYSLKTPTSYRNWHAGAPAVSYAVKGPKVVTHLRKLVGVEQALANFFASGVLALGDGLGPFLWQLPPSLRFDADLVGAFLGQLPRSVGELTRLAEHHDETVKPRYALTAVPTEMAAQLPADRPIRHALEPRHPTWADPAAAAVLSEHEIAMVVSDLGGRYPMFDIATTDFVYVRLHGHEQLYYSGYDDAALAAWAARARAWRDEGRDVRIYFDNSAAGRAPHDALALQRILAGSSTKPR